MTVWSNRDITKHNKRKTILKFKLWRMMRGEITTMKFLKLGLIILLFILIGFLMGYLPSPKENYAAREKGITISADSKKKGGLFPMNIR